LRETIKIMNTIEKSEILNELRKILVIISTSEFNDKLLNYYESNIKYADQKIDTFPIRYRRLLGNYFECNYNSKQPNYNLPQIIEFFLQSSLTFLMEMDKVQAITDDEKNTFKTTGIVLAFYHVFIQPEISKPVIGGRKRISKSFKNSRIRRKSHRRRCRTVKRRRRRSVKRCRL
jgi:hypothetical protein